MKDLTTVELLWLEKRIENRVRFGWPVSEKVVDRNRRVLSFAPGSILAFVRWTSNDFGTVLSRIDILRAAIPGQRYSTVPWITPGGESLLRLSGWPKVERVLQLIDGVEALRRPRIDAQLGLRPAEICALAHPQAEHDSLAKERACIEIFARQRRAGLAICIFNVF